MQFKVGDLVVVDHRYLDEQDIPRDVTFPVPAQVVDIEWDTYITCSEGKCWWFSSSRPGLTLYKGDDPPLGVEAIEHPKHYKIMFRGEEIDAWEIIEAVASDDYHIASVLKYVLRCKKKGNFLQDLKKARQHLDRRIELADDQA